MAEIVVDRKQRRRQGYFFEKYMVSKLSKSCELVRWTSDKRCGKIFAPHSQDPDLGLQVKGHPEHEFAVECKWHYLAYALSEFNLAEDDGQLMRYKTFEAEKGIPVFIAVGLGEIGCVLHGLYIVPLEEIKHCKMTVAELAKFEIQTDVDLVFNPDSKMIEEAH